MEVENKKESALMSNEEFKEYIETNKNRPLNLMSYIATQRFKSVRRAIKRGNVNVFGTILPDRPFNNRGNTSSRKGKHSRSTNELKKRIYAGIKAKQ
jgi:hypothetical protein